MSDVINYEFKCPHCGHSSCEVVQYRNVVYSAWGSFFEIPQRYLNNPNSPPYDTAMDLMVIENSSKSNSALEDEVIRCSKCHTEWSSVMKAIDDGALVKAEYLKEEEQ